MTPGEWLPTRLGLGWPPSRLHRTPGEVLPARLLLLLHRPPGEVLPTCSSGLKVGGVPDSVLTPKSA